ncbi:L-fucose operon activator [Nissabacter sp. SGAir0207]|uniref:L-fucose operon activator n=1 Tax=Nissabacter sp. SGAir0207 TaxID=2126321 RepID=UPI0010CCE43D|nr:L-fucose operon activator [Nissabacter sp. SGAir0207]QCR37881.1 transcriptional regulator [Nissabacter sp. SGAir0207]
MKNTRHEALLKLIAEQDVMSVNQLSEQLSVCRETIRRDLSELQEQGLILRRHGKAKRIIQQDDIGIPFTRRVKSHLHDKDDITRQALAYIEAGMVLALDASTTCWHLARKLPDVPLTVLTNSARVVRELERRQYVSVVCTGGELLRKEEVYRSPALLSLIKHYEIDLFMFSCEGLDKQGTLWDSNDHNAEFKAMLVKRAAQSLLLMDKSKLWRQGVARICALPEVDIIISNRELSLPQASCA